MYYENNPATRSGNGYTSLISWHIPYLGTDTTYVQIISFAFSKSTQLSINFKKEANNSNMANKICAKHVKCIALNYIALVKWNMYHVDVVGHVHIILVYRLSMPQSSTSTYVVPQTAQTCYKSSICKPDCYDIFIAFYFITNQCISNESE